MAKFSDRIGVTQPPTELQINSMNDELRNSLWNLLVGFLGKQDTFYFTKALKLLFDGFFKEPVDDLPEYEHQNKDLLRERFMKCEWYDVYNIIEEILKMIQLITEGVISKEKFQNTLNYILERELSGYRAIEGGLVPITDKQEIEAIRQAVSTSSSLGLNGVREHITKALELLGKKPKPDYRNSIKESISAVESICRRLTGEKNFGKALNKLSQKISLHRALKSGFSSIYGYTSDEGGIRHPILEQTDIGFPEAKFMLVACSAFVNFIIDKAREAKIL